jgi:membrane protein
MIARIWNVLQQTFTRFARNDGITLAAATAYYAAFSFFPLVLVLIAALGFALRFSESAQNAQQQLLELLAERTVPEFEKEVASILSEVETRAPYGGPVGFVILIVGAIGIFSQIEFAFDSLWRYPGRPSMGFGRPSSTRFGTGSRRF